MDKLKTPLKIAGLVLALFVFRYLFSVVVFYLFPQVDYSVPFPPYSFTQPFFDRTDPLPTHITNLWLKWDSLYYLDIVNKGYEEIAFENTQQHNWAFYPLYPLLINSISRWFGFMANQNAVFTAGIVVSHLSFAAGLYFLYKMLHNMKLHADKIITIIAALIAFPGSYFFQLFYAEGLFLFLSVMTFYFLFQRKYLVSSLFLSASVLSRPYGLTMIPAFCVYYFFREWQENRLKVFLMTPLYGIITALPLVVFFYRMYQLTGNFFAAIDIQKAWNYEGFLPFGYFIRYLNIYGPIVQYGLILSVILLLILLGMTIYATVRFIKNFSKYKEHKLEYASFLTYSFVYLFLLTSMQNLSSTYRHAGANIAFFIIPAVFLGMNYKKPWTLLLFFVMISLQALFFTLFLTLIPSYGF